MSSFEYLSARVVLRRLDSGVVEASYYGVLTRGALAALKGMIYQAVGDAPAFVIRLDRALTVDSNMAPPPEWDAKKKIPIAALVVRQEDLGIWTDYSHRVALIGVMRAVFLVSQVELAYQWAEAHALAALSVSLPSRRCKQ